MDPLVRNTDTFETFVMRLAQTARELGIEQERKRIVKLIEDTVSVMPGGPGWADRLIAKIEKGDA